MNIVKEKSPQTVRLLAHLREAGSISPFEALMVHGITRLAARIYDLRRRGHTIRDEARRDETGKRYNRYFLVS